MTILDKEQHEIDNRADQLNPNNDAYHQARGEDQRPEDGEDKKEEEKSKGSWGKALKSGAPATRVGVNTQQAYPGALLEASRQEGVKAVVNVAVVVFPSKPRQRTRACSGGSSGDAIHTKPV